MVSIGSSNIDDDLDDWLDAIKALPVFSSNGGSDSVQITGQWPVTDKRYRLIERRGPWELYEFSITKERNWCRINMISDHGISYAFYDPSISPTWSPPI